MRCVVADLEQLDAEFAPCARACRDASSGSRRELGVLPEEGVGAEADHARCAAARRLVENAPERRGVVGEATEEDAVDVVAELGQQAGAGAAAVDHGAAGAGRRRPREAGRRRPARTRVRAGSAAPIAHTGS